MSLNKVVRYANYLIAVVLVIAAGAVYWLAIRPLPQKSGTLKAPLSTAASIRRDSIGVPHIAAGSIDDALFLQGYVTAQDRLWQMDILRRLAAGDLAEIIGRPALESDQEARKLGMRRIAERHYESLSAGDKAVMAAYARGVNYFLETQAAKLPLEFTLLEYQPRPWRVVDSILVGLQMFRNLTTSWKEDLLKQAMLDKGDPAKVALLFPLRTGSEAQVGSNAWAVAGKLTASGKPILANDTHLEWSLPSTWYLVHLQAPGLNVSGATLPGVPCVIVGHNERIAWGVTNLHFDVQDLYIEKFNPQSGAYEFRGQTQAATLLREIIRIKGEKPLESAIWITGHGPILITDDRRHVSLRWLAAEREGFEFPFLELNRASNWPDFRKALSRFPGPAQNFIYADVDGNIGYQATGRLPIRRGYAGDVPVDGASGQYEWQGYMPFDELPSIFNPPSGRVLTGNQNPFPTNYPYTVSGNFASHYRSRQIEARLKTKAGWVPEDMLSIQTDLYSGFLHLLAGRVVQAWDRHKAANSEAAAAADILRGWNGQMHAELAAPVIVTLVFQHVRRGIAENASQNRGLAYETHMSSAVIDRLLRERPAGWFPDWDKFLAESFTEAIEEGKRLQGREPARWRYGRYFQLTLRHPVYAQIPWFGKYFEIGPVPMHGSSTTVKQTTPRLGPSFRFIADLSDWDRSIATLVVGQSGQALSSHYRDQWDSYYAGRGLPMPFRSVDARSTLTVEPLP